MHLKSLFFVFGLLVVWSTLTSTLVNPNNPPLGNTGAPSETTCVKSGCHSGGNFVGTVSISGVPDTVVANHSYMITLTNASNAVKAGFQLTCLDANNAKCGTLVAGSGSSTGTFSNRQYIRQSAPKNLGVTGSASWTFTWKAPATLAVDSLHFYFVSLAANGNGQNTLDNVLKSNRKAIFTSTSASHEPSLSSLIRLYPNPAVKWVQIDLPTGADGTLLLYDASGKVVLKSDLLSSNQVDVSTLPRGVYMARLEIGREVVTRQLVVGK